MQIRSFRADAVVMATGGCGLVFGKSTNSIICTGAAAARCYQAGVWYGNPEMIQVHPTAIPGRRQAPPHERIRTRRGGPRLGPAQEGRHPPPHGHSPRPSGWYFLEGKYPKYGNIVPRDIATREIFDASASTTAWASAARTACISTSRTRTQGLPPEEARAASSRSMSKFVGEDPYTNPMKIFPAVHYSWAACGPPSPRAATSPPPIPEKHVSGSAVALNAARSARGCSPAHFDNARTNIDGLYAFGEVNFAYHGANRLGANALLSCIFDGLFCGVSS
jgi:succinate dehydrogenase / fumarate reductase flavoprotein subunit